MLQTDSYLHRFSSPSEHAYQEVEGPACNRSGCSELRPSPAFLSAQDGRPAEGQKVHIPYFECYWLSLTFIDLGNATWIIYLLLVFNISASASLLWRMMYPVSGSLTFGLMRSYSHPTSYSHSPTFKPRCPNSTLGATLTRAMPCYMLGAGRTDGEGVERNWDYLNGQGPSTKEMGPGSWWDTLDDCCGHANWRKTVGLGEWLVHLGIYHVLTVIAGNLLLKQMLLAIPQALWSHKDFFTFDECLCEEDTDQVVQWEAKLAAWTEDKSLPDP